MIVWINGTFGVGKTSTAAELVSLVPPTQVFDPEQLGWILARTVGLLRPGDFQHLRSWRRGTIRLIDRTAIDTSTRSAREVAAELASQVLSLTMVKLSE